MGAEGERLRDWGRGEALLGEPHPRVAEAVERQVRSPQPAERLRAELTQRLLALFPPGFSVAHLLHSSSEACELALRLARAHGHGKDVIVLEDDDYGMTTSLANMSPARFRARGGGQKFWVQVARRPKSAADADAVAEKAKVISDSGRGVCGFFAEGVLPDGYLAQAYETVRAAGGLTIAIERQTGMGRIGPAMWEFARHQVTPDIVVVGESLANGLPIAAVVTRAGLAAPFPIHEGSHPLSCAAAIAVLEVLGDLFSQLSAGLGLARLDLDGLRFPVRGSGYCWEIDLAAAQPVMAHLRRRGMEVGIRASTLLIRPPLTIPPAEREQLHTALADALP